MAEVRSTKTNWAAIIAGVIAGMLLIALVIVGFRSCSGPTPAPANPTPVVMAQQPTVAVVAPTAAPAVSASKVEQPTQQLATPEKPTQTAYVSLNYDETNGDPLTPGQSQLIAIYLRAAMGSNGTQSAMEAAISSIQREAQAANATVREGNTFVPPRDHSWLVWCSNASGVTEPTDVSDVFGTHRTGPGKVWVVVPFAAGVPLPTLNTFSNCGGSFWAVAVH